MATRARRSGKPRLAGQIALVTGAGRGIGLAIARALASEGCTLILAGRNLRALEKAGREVTRLGARVLLKACDVSDPQSVAELAVVARQRFKHVDLLINNAGIALPSKPLEKISIDDWRAVIDTNLTGTFLVCRAVLPLMKRGSTVVNVLSLAATRVFAGSSAYNASKHGAFGLTGTLREEVRPRGIRVIAFSPGATSTDLWDTFWPEASRKNMMAPATVAEALVSTLVLPQNSTVEELTILPTSGTL